jgi:hypothetical protein
MDRKSIEETNSGLLTDISGRKNLLVTFGGIQQGIGIPVFEFFNSVSELESDKLFIRDFEQAWYQKGFDEKVRSIDAIADYLETLINSQKYQNVCFLGNSMGAYAAILFGARLNITQVIAFAPQTFINPLKRLWYRDFRWRKQMQKIYANPSKQQEFYDLKKYLSSIHFDTKIHIYYSPNHRLDAIHAKRLEKNPSVNLHAIEKGGHSVVKTVRDRGELGELINDAFHDTK